MTGDSKKQLKILIADDDMEILSLMKRSLRRMEAEFFEASDGDEAERLARTHAPDLILLDVMMPGLSGWEVCRAIRANTNLKHTAIIMLTGIGERLNEMTSPLYGADDYLNKPFDLDELKKRIDAALKKRSVK